MRTSDDDTDAGQLSPSAQLLAMCRSLAERGALPPSDADLLLLQSYVTRCLEPQGYGEVSAEQMQRCLAWLARSMGANGSAQSFAIAQLQPSWLPSRGWRILWQSLSVGTGLLIGGLSSGACAFLLLSIARTGNVLDLFLAVGAGMLLGGYFGLGAIRPLPAYTWSIDTMFQHWSYVLILGLLGGLLAIMNIWAISIFVIVAGSGPGGLLNIGLFGILIGLLIGVIVSGVSTARRAGPGAADDRSWLDVWGFGMLIGFAIGLMVALVIGILAAFFSERELSLTPRAGIFGFCFGYSLGFMRYGGATAIKHAVLRTLLSISSPVPLYLGDWLDAACQRGLLVNARGGYMFAHSLVQAYFASAAVASAER